MSKEIILDQTAIKEGTIAAPFYWYADYADADENNGAGSSVVLLKYIVIRETEHTYWVVSEGTQAHMYTWDFSVLRKNKLTFRIPKVGSKKYHQDTKAAWEAYKRRKMYHLEFLTRSFNRVNDLYYAILNIEEAPTETAFLGQVLNIDSHGNAKKAKPYTINDNSFGFIRND